MTDKARILKEVSKSTIDLMGKEPFYAHIFSTMNKDVVNDKRVVPTMGVGIFKDRFFLYINSKFWDESLTTPELRMGVIKHEVLHIIFKHVIADTKGKNQELCNIAMDMAVNQYIGKSMLTKGGVFVEDFFPGKKHEGKSWEYYYKLLAKDLKKTKARIAILIKERKNKTGDKDGKGKGGDGNKQVKHTHINDGNEQGNKPEQKPDEHTISVVNENGIPKNNSDKTLKTSNNGKGDQDVNDLSFDSHERWYEIKKLSSAQKELLDTRIDSLIKDSIKKTPKESYGTLPGDIVAEIDKITNYKPIINWRREIRMFTAMTGKTRIQNTMKRPSKRFGTTPGTRIIREKQLIVAVDTSLSISNDVLQLFFSEIYHLWRTGIKIHILECDTKIGNEYDYKGVTPKGVTGRGGTIFDEPVKYLNKSKYDGMIYLTDGDGLIDITPRYPVLWAITNQEHNDLKTVLSNYSFLPGKKIKLDNPNKL